MVIWMIPSVVIPTPSPSVIWAVPVVWVIPVPIEWIVVEGDVWTERPAPRVVIVDVDVGVATATAGVIVVVIVDVL